MYFSLANRNWPIFKMAVIKSKMAAAKKSNQEMKILHDTIPNSMHCPVLQSCFTWKIW